MSNTEDTPARQPSFYRSPSNDYEEGYRDAKKEMDALKLELQKQKELNVELVSLLQKIQDNCEAEKYFILPDVEVEIESLIKKSNEI